MYSQILLIIGFCGRIVSATKCNKPEDYEIESLSCCFDAWNEINDVIFNDPCFSVKEDTKIEEKCMLDCFYTSHNLLVNGSIVLENAISFLRSSGTKEYQDIFIEAFELCNKYDWNELVSKFSSFIEHARGECSSKAIIFDSCIAEAVIWRCPKHMWSGGVYCDSVKSFQDKCIFNS